jgi:hypothetical protein
MNPIQFPLTAKSGFLMDANNQHLATFFDGPMGEGAERAAQIAALANRGWTAGTRVVQKGERVTVADGAQITDEDGNVWELRKRQLPGGQISVIRPDDFAWSGEQGRRLLGAGDIIKDGDEDENGAPIYPSLIGLSATHIMVGKVYRKTGK